MTIKIQEHNKDPYNIELDDQKIVEEITEEPQTFWYAHIDGKLFKSDNARGIKRYLFSSKEKLEEELADALYWRKKIIPNIGNNCGYDTVDFYQKLMQAHTVEFKQIQL